MQASFSGSLTARAMLRSLLCLLLFPLPLFLPYLWLEHFYFWGNVDSIFYLNIYTSYRDALKAGELVPHWIASSNVGLGGLAFYSLSPLVYSLTALINAPFSFSDENQFLLGIYASQAFGAWAMWFWLRAHFDQRIALTGALIYTLLPYKLIVLYLHFNLAQLWAMAFLPLWMRAAETVGTRNGQLGYAFAFALCFHAHPLTFLTMAPIAVAYALYRVNWQWRSLITPLLITHAVAFGLIASYLAAMLTAMPWMQLEHWGSDYFSSLKNLHHIDDYFGLYGPAIVYIFYRFRKKHKPGTAPDSVAFWAVVLLVLYVLATPLSYPLWAFVPAMNVFQFPFARIQPGMGIAVTLLGVAMLARKDKEFTMPLLAILIMSVMAIELRLQLVYGHHPDNGITPTIHKTAREGLITTSTMPTPIYFPVWSDMAWMNLVDNYEQVAHSPLVRVRDGKATAKLTGKGNGWLSMQVKVESNIATLSVAQFYVPAWRVHSSKEAIFPTYYPDGRIQLALPKGEYDLRLEITKSTLEEIGDMLTLTSIGLYVGYYAARYRRRARTL